MAAAILKSEIADKASVKVVEAFVAMRRFLSANSQVFQRLETIEYKLLESDQKFEDIYSKLEEKSLKPQQGIFFDGQVYDAYQLICELIKSATSRIILIDNYVDESVLTMLDKRPAGVSASIIPRKYPSNYPWISPSTMRSTRPSQYRYSANLMTGSLSLTIGYIM